MLVLRRPVESAQYVSIRYTERLAEAGIEPSVGSVGDSYDNALAETINGLYKAELIHRRGPWRSFEAVEFATLTWVDWFNHRRLLEPIGNIPPEARNETQDSPSERRRKGSQVKTKRPPAKPGRFKRDRACHTLSGKEWCCRGGHDRDRGPALSPLYCARAQENEICGLAGLPRLLLR